MSTYISGRLETRHPAFDTFIRAVVQTRDEITDRKKPAIASRAWRWATSSKKEFQDWLVQRATEGQCEVGSLDLLRRLRESDNFPVLGVLKSLRPQEAIRGGWAFHASTIAQSSDGVWFLSSPANYEAPVEPKVILNTSLKEALEEFSALEGGTWPDAGFIGDSIKQGQFARPREDSVVTEKGFYCRRLFYTEAINNAGVQRVAHRCLPLVKF